MKTPSFCVLLLLPALLRAQDACLCCKKQQSGQDAYDRGDYTRAIDQWQRGQQMTDAAKCPDLARLIWKAQDMDGDGVVNGKDKCPEQSGPARNAGCPLAPRPTSTNNVRPPANIWMAFVAGGQFNMGDSYQEGEANESPHPVKLRNFEISKYEVSFEAFDAFCVATNREKPSDNGWGRGNLPVINVDWYDAVEYCNWRSRQAGYTPCYTIDKINKDPNNTNSNDSKRWTVTCNWNANGYRLPTEAEWEYAAREGGKKVRFGNGRDVIDPSEVNFNALDVYRKNYSVAGDYRRQTVPVDQLGANALGLKNMSGNVWEWCWDWYDATIYRYRGVANAPKGLQSGEYRVLRGGSWLNFPENCRAADRGWNSPDIKQNNYGFRVARNN